MFNNNTTSHTSTNTIEFPRILGTIGHLTLRQDRSAKDVFGIKFSLLDEGQVVRVWDASFGKDGVSEAWNFELRRQAWSTFLADKIKWSIEDMGPRDLGVTVFSYSDGDECEGVNLDGESIAGLLKFAAAVRNPDVGMEMIAKRIFPVAYADNSDTAEQATFQLARYAALKASSMDLRKDGDINDAMYLETICETIYRELPEFARW